MPQPIRDRLFSLIQYPLPHHLLSKLMYLATRVRWQPFKNAFIRFIIKRFNIDMSIAQKQNLNAYACFNDFFTRPLLPEARPIAAEASAIACPVDGTISQLGDIADGRVFQAKGHDYSLQALIGGYQHLHDDFAGGQFATIYLSPQDYHRIHMPVTGRLREVVYVPGRLFSVNPATTRNIPGLFARNERLVAVFDTALGQMAVILVGAIFVAGIETVWSGNFGEKMFRAFQHWDYQNDKNLPDIRLEKGEEMGRFNMGSTVILLFEHDKTTWVESLLPDQSVIMGQKIASAK